jgi:hypothetical protein
MRHGHRWLGAAACLVVLLSSACSGTKAHTTSAGTSSSTSLAPASVPGAATTTAPQIETVVPGDIPDNQTYVTYASVPARFRIKVPEGWARSGSGSDVTFTDKYNSIRINLVRDSSAPTVRSVSSSELPTLRRTTPGYRSGKVSQVSRPAGAAILTTYQAASAPNPVTGKSALLDVERYEFWSSGTRAIVTLSGAAGSDNVDPWRTVTDSFAWA